MGGLLLGWMGKYSGLNLNQYGVASPCPDLNLIHYNLCFLWKTCFDCIEAEFSDDLWVMARC